MRDQGVIAGQRHFAFAARGHVGRQSHPQHLAEWGEVVVGRPAAEREDLRNEGRLVVVEDGMERAEFRGGVGRPVVELDDETGRALRPDRHFDTRAEADRIPQTLGDRIRERGVHGQRNGDLGVGGQAGGRMKDEG